MPPILIGTRGSALALAQSGMVRDALAARWPGREFLLSILKTEGDAWAAKPENEQTPPPGKGIFTRAFEEALRAGTIHLAIHSLKDLPVDDADGVAVAAIPLRADPRDVLVTRGPQQIVDLPPHARLGTGSLRRAAQLRAVRPDLAITPLRGNIDTRLRRLREGAHWDGIVLAAAGLLRLGPSLADVVVTPLSIDLMLPAPGQGALALQIRRGDEATAELVAPLHDAATAAAVRAERAFLAGLGGGCLAPIGAHAMMAEGQLRLQGIAWIGDAAAPRSGYVSGAPDRPEELGQQLAVNLMGHPAS